MRIITKARHTEISDQLKEYAEKKIGDKCLQYLDESDDSIVCEIEFDDQYGPKEGVDKRVDVTIALPHQHLPVHIQEIDATFQEAIDRAADRLDQPLAKYKETMHSPR